MIGILTTDFMKSTSILKKKSETKTKQRGDL